MALRERSIDILAVDNIHRLAAPMIGGFVELNRANRMVRELGGYFSWILSIDRIAWQFIHRVRADGAMSARTIHLQPWTEDQIDQLLRARSKAAGIEPNYDRLVLPRQLDEMAYEVEGDRKRHGFNRILWDSSEGNPAVALRSWCDSLIVDPGGEIVVQLSPDRSAADLEDLSIAAQFVLRYLAQVEYASLDDVVRGVSLPRADVEMVIHAAQARGLVDEQEGLMRLSWSWFRGITRFLVRQNLLSAK